MELPPPNISPCTCTWKTDFSPKEVYYAKKLFCLFKFTLAYFFCGFPDVKFLLSEVFPQKAIKPNPKTILFPSCGRYSFYMCKSPAKYKLEACKPHQQKAQRKRLCWNEYQHCALFSQFMVCTNQNNFD